MTGPAVPPGSEELREALIDTLRLYGIRGERLGFRSRPQSVADAVLALPEMRDALAAQETLRRVEELAEELRGHADALVAHPDQMPAFHGRQVRLIAYRLRALAGDAIVPLSVDPTPSEAGK